jgi:hypothetical protein
MKAQALILLIAASSALAQGTFRNLDFEEAIANISPDQPAGFVSAADGLPGWNAYVSSTEDTNVFQQLSQIGFNNPALSSTWVSVQSDSAVNAPALDGSFSVLLQSGINATPTGFSKSQSAISQTGIVPASAHSLIFRTTGPVLLSLAGRPIYLSAVPGSPGLVGGNISAFEGQTVELRLAALSSGTANPFSALIDDIQFSNMVIPEPSAIPLSVIAVLLVTLRVRCGKKA